jgi:hypothetical protein
LLVQFGSLLLVVLLLVLYPPRHTGTWHLVVGLAAYAAAKVLVVGDREIFARGQIVSGHTLKHLAAAGGVACLLWPWGCSCGAGGRVRYRGIPSNNLAAPDVSRSRLTPKAATKPL